MSSRDIFIMTQKQSKIKRSHLFSAALLALGVGLAVSALAWRFANPSVTHEEPENDGLIVGIPVLTHPSCVVQVNLVASAEQHAHFTERLAYVQDQFATAELNLCASRFSLDTIARCDERARRVTCELDMALLPAATDITTVTVVASGRGIANTRNGVVFVPEHASGLLLQHELGHALGLADEYPMRGTLAKAFCGGEFSFQPLNLVFTSSDVLSDAEKRKLHAQLPWQHYLDSPIATQQEDGQWRLGTEQKGDQHVGLFPAATCHATGVFAWKPVGDVTFMEHHELGAVPDLYLRLIVEQLK